MVATALVLLVFVFSISDWRILLNIDLPLTEKYLAYQKRLLAGATLSLTGSIMVLGSTIFAVLVRRMDREHASPSK